MNRYSTEPSAWEKISTTTTLTQTQSSVIKQTYILLGVAVICAMAGGYIGSTSELVLGFMTTKLGFIAALVLLNVVPWIAMACRHNPVLGVTALVADGFLAGIVISPLLYYATLIAPEMILIAFMVTGAVFTAITAYIFTTKREFSAPKGLMIGLFVAVSAAVVLNMFMNIGWLGVLISAGIGIMGVFGLVYSTSGVLRSSDSDSPIPGALALFAGLFNVFVATLNILLRLTGGGGRRS
jgi:modulator of FtsH protease